MTATITKLPTSSESVDDFEAITLAEIDVPDEEQPFEMPLPTHANSTLFFTNGRFNPYALAKEIRDEHKVKLGYDGRLWRYEHGVYVPNGEALVREYVKIVLGGDYAPKRVNEVVQWFRDAMPKIGLAPDARYINVVNGLLDWRTGELKPHSPDVVSIVQVPVEWDTEAQCPAIDKFLREVLSGDVIETAYEVVGYCLWTRQPYKKAALLLGGGDNGKSVFLAVITRLLGARNVISVPLQEFAEDRFAKAQLHGRLANICGDLDARAVTRSDAFKKITGGDSINAQHKYGHPFEFTPFSTLLFSANEPPLSADQSEAYFSRWMILEFLNEFKGKSADRGLTWKLTRPVELQGLFARAVEGLRRLERRHGFDDEVPSLVASSKSYREALDSAVSFVEEFMVLDHMAVTPKAQVYKAYREWCQQNGRQATSALTFNRRLLREYDGRLTETRPGGVKSWAGIRFATPGEVRT